MCRPDDFPPYDEETDQDTWVCRFCGSPDDIAAISLVPRSQGMGPLVGKTLEETDPSWDTGWDEAYWESETITGYECRNCSPGTEHKTLEELVVKKTEYR